MIIVMTIFFKPFNFTTTIKSISFAINMFSYDIGLIFFAYSFKCFWLINPRVESNNSFKITS